MKKIATLAVAFASVASFASAQSLELGAVGSAGLTAEMIAAALFAIVFGGALLSNTTTSN